MISKIQQMIAELCPEGVEYKRLGEVCDFQNGFAFKSTKFTSKGDIVIRITNIDGKRVCLDDVKYFSQDDYKEDFERYQIKDGDILLAMSGATTGKIGYYDYEFVSYLNQRVGKFFPKKTILANRYLFHYLLSQTATLYLLAGGGTQPNLSSIRLMNIEIPVPPIPIQNEIVRILDKFTELEAELACRKRQYEYYRDNLLNFKDVITPRFG